MSPLRLTCSLLAVVLAACTAQAADLHRVWLDGDGAAYGRVVGSYRTVLVVKDKFADVLVSEDEAAELRRQGLRMEFVQKDPEGYARRIGAAPAQAGYHRYGAMVESLEALQRAYPALVRLEDCGDSWEKSDPGSPPGHDIWAVRVHSERAERLSKPALLLLGGVHARELGSTEIVLRLVRWLAESYETDPEVRNLLETRRIWAIPLLNPDGREFVFDSDPWWRKTRRRMPGPGNVGVDLNRNFPFFWSSELGASAVPSSAVYHGDSPLSEPESQALVALVDRIRPAASLSFHAYGRYVLMPFGYPVRLPDDSGVMRKLGRLLGETTGYEVGTVGQLLGYWSSGRHDDWMYASRGVMAFELELGRTFFPEPAELLELTSVAKRAAGLLARACGPWPQVDVAVRKPHPSPAGELRIPQPARGAPDGGRGETELELVFSNQGVDDAIHVGWALRGSGPGVLARPGSGVVPLVPGLRRARHEPVRVTVRLPGQPPEGGLQLELSHDGSSRPIPVNLPFGSQPTE
jgi:hypothetical protein